MRFFGKYPKAAQHHSKSREAKRKALRCRGVGFKLIAQSLPSGKKEEEILQEIFEGDRLKWIVASWVDNKAGGIQKSRFLEGFAFSQWQTCFPYLLKLNAIIWKQSGSEILLKFPTYNYKD
jgi:hypothetical protein